MPLERGTMLGPYEIVAPLGAGGMGEVYRARDTRLDRTVAVKVLHARVSEAGDHRARFEREARAVSNLNHPHICALHDIGRQDQTDYLVMEFLEGETLEERLAAGPVPVAEALAIAVQIAGALDAAHRHGVVHRDLKPGNVILTESGAKLLDFGIARMTGTAAAGATAGSGAAPTVTMAGSLVGTFPYMAPEQLEGKEADPRTDIFAFGALLYELLTGRRAFGGGSPAGVITAIMSVEPRDVSAVRPEAPPALGHVVRKCLAKQPRDRWQSARDLLGELQWIAEQGRAAPEPPPRERGAYGVWVVGGIFAALFGASLVPAVRHLTERPEPRTPVAFTVPVPAGHSFQWYDTPAVSPDGGRIVFSASTPDGATQLFLRHLNAPGAVPVPHTENARFPFWRPDGGRVAFFSRTEKRLKSVDLAGGPASVICAAEPGLGGSWSADGVILFARPGGPLQRVAAEGGEPRDALPLEPGERSHAWPQFLPGGRRFLYFSNASGSRQAGTYAATLGSSGSARILDAAARYTAPKFLLFAREEVLMARPFDAGRLSFTGEAFPAAEPVAAYGRAPGSVFSASANGVLCFRAGAAKETFRYVWHDRAGNRLGTAGEAADLSNPALSPDGRLLAYGRRDPRTDTRDIWVHDLARGAATRVTFHPANDFNPVFSPDGRRIVFTSDRGGTRNLYVAAASGAGEASLLAASDAAENAEDWSPDGRFLVFNRQTRGSPADVYALPVDGERKPIPLLTGDFAQDQAQVSPDGRWVAYKSEETGQPEIYVRSFAPAGKAPEGKWRVSTAGGMEPRWRADGGELFYVQQSTLMAVEVKTVGAAFEAGIPAPLFNAHFAGTGRNRYVAAPDGRRFLLQSPLEDAPIAPLHVFLHWDTRRR